MTTALVVFAKAPVAGYAKTRLIPALGAAGAARLAERLLDHTLRQCQDMPLAHWELCVSPDVHHPAFAQAVAAARGRLTLTQQGEGDLGVRMHRALARVLATHDKGLLIGTDAPGLGADILRRAEDALSSHDAVFVPALDGGYALVGLTRGLAALFEGVRWSSAHVMDDTRERARRAGISWIELESVADIDEPGDLRHLPGAWRE